MTRNDIIFKWIAYGLALAVITVLNYYILGLLPIALPLLLPVAAVAAGILEGPSSGAGFGLAAGLVMATLGHHSLICIPVLAGVGWICGLLSQHVLRRDLVGHLICAALVLLAWESFTVLLHLRAAPLSLLAKVSAAELFWSLVFSFPVYWAIHFCCVRYGRIYHE